MSAALQLPLDWEGSRGRVAWREQRTARKTEAEPATSVEHRDSNEAPLVSLAFYRKHTESLLRRYLYASMQVGRAPSLLSDPVARGWASSRPVRTFEDAVIFVLDIEKCLQQLSTFDRELLGRVVLQEYTQAEAATLLGMSVRAISYKLGEAVDRLTEKLLAAGLLVVPR
ncbi:MAG TPA: sigma factor-like helix-turn-helix DNA-binding protein [Terracidiphilus sp.]|nr:sigma factor-like helix-turn-helix DNA-binding protein [Terracidiphilus sp.]